MSQMPLIITASLFTLFSPTSSLDHIIYPQSHAFMGRLCGPQNHTQIIIDLSNTCLNDGDNEEVEICQTMKLFKKILWNKVVQSVLQTNKNISLNMDRHKVSSLNILTKNNK